MQWRRPKLPELGTTEVSPTRLLVLPRLRLPERSSRLPPEPLGTRQVIDNFPIRVSCVGPKLSACFGRRFWFDSDEKCCYVRAKEETPAWVESAAFRPKNPWRMVARAWIFLDRPETVVISLELQRFSTKRQNLTDDRLADF